MFSTPTILISCRNIVLFFAYIKITNFREAATCRQKTYTSARIFFRCCYAFVVFFRSWFVCPFWSGLVRLLGSSFAFFCLEFSVEKMQMCYQMRWLFQIYFVSYISVVKPKTMLRIFFCFSQFVFCRQRVCVCCISGVWSNV